MNIPTVCLASQLMNEIEHVIFTIDVTPFTVAVVRISLLVSDHGLLGVEMLEAIGVGALDLHLESREMVG